MCKLAFARTRDGTAYKKVIGMIEFQENTVAGHSTGLAWLDKQGMHIRKAVGKINSFLAEYPDKPYSNTCLGHSRYATVGAINTTNQHPISIMYHGKRIGYAVHNGSFREYKSYEYLRKGRIKNETDSAVLFSIYSYILEKMGDSPENRRKAFAYIMKMISDGGTANIIIMFRNGQILFSGNILTYKQTKEAIGVMTFGLHNHTKEGIIYEIKGFTINKYRPGIPSIIVPKKIPKKDTIYNYGITNGGVYQKPLYSWGIR